MRKKITAILLICSVLLCLPRICVCASAAADDSISTVDVGITPYTYNKLISDRENIERPAEASVNGAVYRHVSINARGQSSRMIGQLMPSKRVPFRIKFSGDAGLHIIRNSSVIFKNSFTPFRLLAEYIAMDLFAYMEVPIPAHELSFVRFNGHDLGLYLAIEDVNDIFLAGTFPGELGSLYKSTDDVQPEHISSVWFKTLEVKADRGNENLLRLIQALDRGEGYEEFLDMDEFLRALACIAAIGGGGSFVVENKNFILYDNHGKFVLIPWDLDDAFRDYYSDNSIDCFYLQDDVRDPNPLFQLLMSNPEHKAKYRAYLRQITETFFEPDALRTYTETLVHTAAPYLLRDRSILRNSETIESDLLNAVRLEACPLLYTLENYRQSIVAQLDGTANRFFYNPQYETEEMEPSEEGFINYYLKDSPMLDTRLPSKIRWSYFTWKLFKYTRYADMNKTVFVAVGVFCAGAAAVAVSFILPRYKGRRGKREPAKADE